VLFVREALRLVAAPSRPSAMRCFHASLAQLSMLLLGAMIDAAVA
jgi:heme O synthase-like polyprenyltransferase